jgi:hypothetical protein
VLEMPMPLGDLVCFVCVASYIDGGASRSAFSENLVNFRCAANMPLARPLSCARTCVAFAGDSSDSGTACLPRGKMFHVKLF